MARTRLALAATLLIGMTAVTPSASAAPPPRLDWAACDNGMQCAVMRVPVDWANPGGPTTVIDVVKVPARKPLQRNDSVLVNLGAGNSTMALFGQRPPMIEEMLRKLTERLDVVVFDPRGLGRTPGSTQTRCPKPSAPITGLILAKNEADWQAHAKTNAEFEVSCREATGAAFAGLNSWQMAHDLEALRAAVGQEKLRYFGNSYGTVYAQAYAELFPKRVGRIYIDGVADHTQAKLEDWLRNYAIGQEQQLSNFRDWCAQRTGCLLHGKDVVKVWDELVARAPLPTADGRTVSAEQLFAGAMVGMTPPLWPNLARAMSEALAGDAGKFLTELQYPPGDGRGSVQSVTLCHDFMPKQPSYQEFLGIEKRLKAVAPHFGWIEGRFELGRCVGTSGERAYPPHPLKAPGVPPVLVGIGKVDANTNNLGAAHVASQLSGARVLWHDDGHAAYIMGNNCLREHANRYLFDGVLPGVGTRCPGELTAKIPDRP